MENKICQNCKCDFTIDSDDFSFYEKMKVPAPTWCPECRLGRRLAWRNDRYLSKANCQLCGKATLSNFPQDSQYVVLCLDCWTSDKYDATEYGRDYDFSRPFFEQFKDLMGAVPIGCRFVSVTTVQNSEYTNLVSNLKNCYLIYNADYDENCMYGSEIEHSKECIDNTMIENCEQSYGNINCQKCYKVFFSTDCIESSDIHFSYDLVGCMNCFGCVGLRNKNYYIFNQPFPKEKYQEKIKELFDGSYSELVEIEKRVKEIYFKIPKRYMHGRQNTGVSGDYIYHSKNVKDSFVISEAENCRYIMWLIVPGAKDCYDHTEFGGQTEKIYEGVIVGVNIFNVKFCCAVTQNSMNIEYSYRCSNAKNLFGCAGIKKKSYCIFNKQYTKEAYEELVPKIIKHMDEMPYIDKKGRVYKYGEFFPFELSPHPYNQSNAQEFFPITKKGADDLGANWKDISDKSHILTMSKDKIPNLIRDVSDSILNEIIECAEWENEKSKTWNCTKAFRITENELAFYKKHNIPLPRKCPNCRHHDRVQKRNPPKFWHRCCMKEGCINEFETTYAPDKLETVYCERCYQQEVY